MLEGAVNRALQAEQPRWSRVLVLLALAGCDNVFNLDHIEPLPTDAAQPGLLAWYPMDRLDGNTLADATGHGHTGSCTLLSTCPSSTGGKIGNSLRFNGSQHIIRVPSADDLDMGGPFTVMAWVRIDMLPSSYACAVNKVLGAANSWQMCINFEGKPMFGTEGETLISTTMISVDKWHHLAMRWDGGTKQIVIDGVEKDTSLMSPTFGAGDIFIGADSNGGAFAAGFPGSIDEVRIYNRALTALEIFAVSGI
jgi:hypothetical protein